jgi:hypothetical protein
MRARSPSSLGGLLATVVVLSGCDLPTEAPIFEQTWALPLSESVVAAEDIAPASLTPVAGGFAVSVDPADWNETLGPMCGAPCQALNGLVAPVPAFRDTLARAAGFPAEMALIHVASSAIDVLITNQLGFDPTENGGFVLIEALDASGGLLGSSLLDGSTGLPNGTTRSLNFTLRPGPFRGAFRVIVNVVGGQTALIDTSGTLTVQSNATSMVVTGARLTSISETFSFSPDVLDIEVSDGIREGLQSGTIQLAVANPWGISLSGYLDFGSVRKSLSIPSASTSSVRLEFSGQELQSMLGGNGVAFSGTATATGTDVEIFLSDKLRLAPTLFVVVQP